MYAAGTVAVSSDEEASPPNEQEELPPSDDFFDHLPNLCDMDTKTTTDVLWNWLMFNQRMLNQQLLPLLPCLEYQAGGTEEAIAHGERFLKWLEETHDPTVTRFKVIQLKQLLFTLKNPKKNT